MIFEEMQGPNENRFIYINHLPDVVAKFSKCDAPDFKRYAYREIYKMRNNISAIHNQKSFPDYNPNKDYI